MKKIEVFSVAYVKVFGWGTLATALGLGISAFFFRESLLLAATGLGAILLIPPMNELLSENRDAIWLHRRSAWEANSILVLKIAAIFSGVFLTTMLAQLVVPDYVLAPVTPPVDLLFNNEPGPLFRQNLRVLLACLLLAFVYRGGGLLLVICWNAMSWSTSILAYLMNAHAAGAKHAWLYSLAMVPHLILETIAYVTSGMTGVFLSKALFKYKLSSAKFFRVSRACVVLLAASVVYLWLAMRFEIGLAQAVLHGLQK